MRRVSVLLVVLLMVVAAPAGAVTDRGTRARAATGRVADTCASSSPGWTEGSVGRTVNEPARQRLEPCDAVRSR